MKQYLDLLQTVLHEGQRESNRTGIDTLTIPGAMMKFDLRDGFPAVTTKKLAWKQVVGELIGFLRGYTSAADFRSVGCTIWDQNANENEAWLNSWARKGEDHLGRIYGYQWRHFGGNWDDEKGGVLGIDQIEVALNTLRNNPESRRIIVNAWNPADLDQAALPPCHVLFQLLPRSDGTLHMTMYQRSCDMFLGIPFNIASYALLLELFAAWSGRKAATLTMFLADVHIYENHIDQVTEQLARETRPLPKLRLDVAVPNDAETAPLESLLAALGPNLIYLEDYDHHPPISAPMAV